MHAELQHKFVAIFDFISTMSTPDEIKTVLGKRNADETIDLITKRAHTSVSASSESVKLPCKFFSSGYCRFGEGCSFSHAKLAPGKLGISCRFFQTKGFCAEGSNCRFLHVSPSEQIKHSPPVSPTPSPESKTIVCKFHIGFRGCKAGDACPFLHPPKEEDETPLFMVDASESGEGRKILEKYSMAKTAEEQGQEAIVRKQPTK